MTADPGEMEAADAGSCPGDFRITHRDGAARIGSLRLPHGSVETPAFMPVGTQGTVKGLSPDELSAMGAQMILANAYHLYLRPGHEIVSAMGGLHGFMGWDGPVLTDSGGYQVFSLSGINRVTDEGVWFQSHIDGSRHLITPERSLDIQLALGADVIMAFDECPPGDADRETVARATDRTARWLEACVRRYDEWPEERSGATSQVLLPVIQGGPYADLRRESLDHARQLREWMGFGIGGLSVGEEKDVTLSVLETLEPNLPENGVRYVMGLGYPEDLLQAIRRGYDLFDCVAPTRNGRNGTVFTSTGQVNVKIAAWKDDAEPVEPGCGCYTCRHFSRAYVRHLFVAGELLGLRLASIHNLHFLIDLTARARAAIRENELDGWLESWLDRYRANQE